MNITEMQVPVDGSTPSLNSPAFKHNMSYSNPNFSGRERELAEIQRILDNSHPLHQRVVLYGLGGIGYEFAEVIPLAQDGKRISSKKNNG